MLLSYLLCLRQFLSLKTLGDNFCVTLGNNSFAFTRLWLFIKELRFEISFQTLGGAYKNTEFIITNKSSSLLDEGLVT